MTDDPSGAQFRERLLDATLRLVAELDRARCYQAAAYASMAAAVLRDGATPGSGPGSAPPQDERGLQDLRTDVELQFEADEHGRVWMIRDGDCHIIGRTGAVCAEMRRFLAAVVLGRRDGS